MELPDDSGKQKYEIKLPDDSGDRAMDRDARDHIYQKEGDMVLKPDSEKITSKSVESLQPTSMLSVNRKETGAEKTEKIALSPEKKALIKEETGWSDEIINAVESMEQYEIYKNAGLHEAEINGRKCLLKDIDLDYVDTKTGLTNRELMEKGRSPIDARTGEKIELHHMGQEFDAPFAELTENHEHGDGNHSILHTKMEGSFRNDPELLKQYQREKVAHWKLAL